jgi:hypothetical protein
MFRVREADRAAVITWLEAQFAIDQPIDALAFDRRSGNRQQQIGQLDAEVLTSLDPEAAVDECIERWCTSAGRWQFRLIIQERDEAGERIGSARNIRRTVDVAKEARAGSGAKGDAAAMESMATSYGGAFDQLTTQVMHQGARTDSLVDRMLAYQHDYHTQRTQEATEWAAEVQTLSLQLARAEAYIEAMESHEPTKIPPEVWAQILPAGVQLITALSSRLMSTAQLGPGASAPAAPQAAPSEAVGASSSD